MLLGGGATRLKKHFVDFEDDARLFAFYFFAVVVFLSDLVFGRVVDDTSRLLSYLHPKLEKLH
tara:strand:+ start:315 stop:503 length:189 start_codon:yes stop_codon:yes gene_type:complete